MRYKLPRNGETRIRKKFFWLPAEIENSSYVMERIWLESAFVKEVYRQRLGCWIHYQFVDDCEETINN